MSREVKDKEGRDSNENTQLRVELRGSGYVQSPLMSCPLFPLSHPTPPPPTIHLTEQLI